MICYSNYPLNMWSKISLDSSRNLHGNSGGGFVIRLYLILEIGGQRWKKFGEIFFWGKTKHDPWTVNINDQRHVFRKKRKKDQRHELKHQRHVISEREADRPVPLIFWPQDSAASAAGIALAVHRRGVFVACHSRRPKDGGDGGVRVVSSGMGQRERG